MSDAPHIAVIGAGIAGLSCAAALQQGGVRVSVCDKSGGVAGRMSTRRGDGWQCDHGAQYFTASDPAFRVEVARWQLAGAAAPWSPRQRDHERAPDEAWLVGVPRMTAPGRLLADALPIKFKTTISGLARDDGGWRLHTLEHGALTERFDAVVLAIPAPQAAALLQRAAPALAELAGRARMRSCWALMVRFDSPVALPFDVAAVNHEPLAWIARDSSKPGRHGSETWILHASADWSEAHREDDAATVAATLLAAFTALGAPVAQAWSAHRWRYALAAPALIGGSVWRAEDSLGLCGDWLHRGTIEGAWLSGRRLAGELLQTFTITADLPT
jgi:predicted NAD/FAD-dependent oxidoreductase